MKSRVVSLLCVDETTRQPQKVEAIVWDETWVEWASLREIATRGRVREAAAISKDKSIIVGELLNGSFGVLSLETKSRPTVRVEGQPSRELMLPDSEEQERRADALEQILTHNTLWGALARVLEEKPNGRRFSEILAARRLKKHEESLFRLIYYYTRTGRISNRRGDQLAFMTDVLLAQIVGAVEGTRHMPRALGTRLFKRQNPDHFQTPLQAPGAGAIAVSPDEHHMAHWRRNISVALEHEFNGCHRGPLIEELLRRRFATSAGLRDQLDRVLAGERDIIYDPYYYNIDAAQMARSWAIAADHKATSILLNPLLLPCYFSQVNISNQIKK